MTPEAISSLLNQCSKIKALRHCLPLHAFALKAGMRSDIVISNHILNVYAKCGCISDARQVFDEMPERNLVSWSAMISGYDQIGEHVSAVELFSRLPIVPNEYVFSSVISSCGSLADLVRGQQIHGQALKCGSALVSFVSNALISMYMECGRCGDGMMVHEEMVEPDVVSYNALIAGFVENEQSERAFEMFKVMHQHGIFPDRFTFSGVLGSCSSLEHFWRGALLHCHTIKLKLDSSAFVGNVLMAMYSRFNLIDEAEKVFNFIEERDTISWNSFIAACSHCGDPERALRVFGEMFQEVCVKPDDFTFASALAACAGLASLHYGKQIHAHLIRTRWYHDMGSSNALVNMYAKCGSIENAYYVFSRMASHSPVSWNTMIAGFGNHGLAERAIELFKEMKLMGVEPDTVTFIGLLTACNHAGLVDKGQSFFKMMEQTYGILPVIEQFSCLIDLLGRAGRLYEAEEYIKKYPFGHDPVILGSFLSACRLQGNIVIGERLGRELLKLQPVSTSPFILLSHLFAADDSWEGVAEARKMLKGSGIKKEPGHSLIEMKGTVHKFVIGDYSHSKIEEIKSTLKTFSREAGEESPGLLRGWYWLVSGANDLVAGRRSAHECDGSSLICSRTS